MVSNISNIRIKFLISVVASKHQFLGERANQSKKITEEAELVVDVRPEGVEGKQFVDAGTRHIPDNGSAFEAVDVIFFERVRADKVAGFAVVEVGEDRLQFKTTGVGVNEEELGPSGHQRRRRPGLEIDHLAAALVSHVMEEGVAKQPTKMLPAEMSIRKSSKSITRQQDWPKNEA